MIHRLSRSTGQTNRVHITVVNVRMNVTSTTGPCSSTCAPCSPNGNTRGNGVGRNLGRRVADFAETMAVAAKDSLGFHAPTIRSACALKRGSRLVMCRISVDGKDVGRAMVVAGAAWVDPRSTSPYMNDQQDAQKSGKGLWSDPASIPPWEHRKSAEAPWQQAT